MAETTEIYMCRAGQPLKQGQVAYSDSISTRDDARADAEERCRFNKRLAKIAYYAVNENGDFRIIYTHTNPDAIGMEGEKKAKPKKKKKKPVKKSLVERVIKTLTGPVKKSKSPRNKKK